MPFSFGAKAFGIAKCRPLRRGLPLRSMCGRNLRFPPHTPPSFFCDTIQFAIETDRSCHRQRPGAGSRSGLFSLPQICAPVPADLSLPGSKKAPERVPSFGLYHRLPQDSPSLAQLRPFTLTPRESQRAAPRRGGGSVPRRQYGTAKRPFRRAAPHAGHRLVLNPCRRAAHRNSSFFSIHSPSPAPFSLRDGQQNKKIFCFLVT